MQAARDGEDGGQKAGAEKKAKAKRRKRTAAAAAAAAAANDDDDFFDTRGLNAKRTRKRCFVEPLTRVTDLMLSPPPKKTPQQGGALLTASRSTRWTNSTSARAAVRRLGEMWLSSFTLFTGSSHACIYPPTARAGTPMCPFDCECCF